MYVDSGWLDSNPTPNYVYFNSQLADLLNLPANFRNPPPSPNGTDVQTAIKNYAPLLPAVNTRFGFPFALNTLAGNILNVSQEYVQLSSFSDVQSIMFTSNLMPIIAEYVPFSVSPNQSVNTGARNLPVITDYVLIREDAKPRDSSFVYLPTAEYRLFDLQGTLPMTGIDVKAYYVGANFAAKPLYLPPDGSFSIKIMFRRKKKFPK
jgi:hypothetical protein